MKISVLDPYRASLSDYVYTHACTLLSDTEFPDFETMARAYVAPYDRHYSTHNRIAYVAHAKHLLYQNVDAWAIVRIAMEILGKDTLFAISTGLHNWQEALCAINQSMDISLYTRDNLRNLIKNALDYTAFPSRGGCVAYNIANYALLVHPAAADRILDVICQTKALTREDTVQTIAEAVRVARRQLAFEFTGIAQDVGTIQIKRSHLEWSIDLTYATAWKTEPATPWGLPHVISFAYGLVSQLGHVNYEHYTAFIVFRIDLPKENP
jgi:hypothetical protein